jgi:hypothetical protein
VDNLKRKAAIPYGAQEEIHRTSGYAKGFISTVANGKASPTPDARKVAARLARKAGMPARDLFPEYFAKRLQGASAR